MNIVYRGKIKNRKKTKKTKVKKNISDEIFIW